MKDSQNLYEKLVMALLACLFCGSNALSSTLIRQVASTAPAIFGHDDVKKGSLLMLFGGVHKETPEAHCLLLTLHIQL